MRFSRLVTSILTVVTLCSVARTDERYLDFVEQLQERGYHDMVVEYVQRVRSLPEAASTVGIVADYYIGKSLVAGSNSVSDLAKRDDQLKTARIHFQKFIQQHPQHDHVADAQMGQADILVQQGRIALMQADNPIN